MKTTALSGVRAGWQCHTRPTPPNPAAVTNRRCDPAAHGDLDDEHESQERPQGPALSSRKASLSDLAARSDLHVEDVSQERPQGPAPGSRKASLCTIINDDADILPDEDHHSPTCAFQTT
jgi:hypothetical protein